MDNINQTIGNKLYAARTIKGINQQTAANNMEISISQYSRIERGAISITVEQLIAASNAFNVSIPWLIDESDNLELTSNESYLVELYKQFLISTRNKR